MSRCLKNVPISSRNGFNFIYARGEAGTSKITVEKPSGAPFDLTPFDVVYRVVSLEDSQLVFEKTLGQGIRVIDLSGGLLELVFDPSDTDREPGPYAHELRITDHADYAESVMTGYFNVEPSIF